MPSLYDEAYERSLRDPEGFWASAAEDIYWDRPGTRSSTITPALLPLVRRAAAQHLLQRPRRPRRARPRQAARPRSTTARSPAPCGPTPTTSFATRSRASPARCARPGHRARATASSSTCPWCPRRSSPCSPARASAPFTPSCSAASRSHELAKRIDDATPKMILSASCGIEVGRMIAYKPLLDQAIAARAPQARALRGAAAPAGEGASSSRDATSTGTNSVGRRARRRSACRVAATDLLYILYTSGTTGIPKGVVRDNGGHAVALKWSMGNVYGLGSGRGVLGRLGHRLGGRPLLHRLRRRFSRAARPSSTRASPWARPIPAPSGG